MLSASSEGGLFPYYPNRSWRDQEVKTVKKSQEESVKKDFKPLCHSASASIRMTDTGTWKGSMGWAAPSRSGVGPGLAISAFTGQSDHIEV